MVLHPIMGDRDREGLWARMFFPERFEGTIPTNTETFPLLWWRTLRGTCELADVATRVLALHSPLQPRKGHSAPSLGFIVREGTGSLQIKPLNCLI
ncbi:hypothetical protein J6590_001031 [Homalodisca vitripennis]|nr:hypothetical protein J6590_001031 [Homalodisca vitripennis]